MKPVPLLRVNTWMKSQAAVAKAKGKRRWGGPKRSMSKCSLGDIHVISSIVKVQAQKSNDVSSNKELPIPKYKTGKSSNMALPHLFTCEN